jgi:hypothetical protein
MGRGIGWIVVALLLGHPANAYAQPVDESLHKEGVALRRQHRDAEALAVFERALALDGSARTRAQVALAEEALGLWVEAERDLSSALAEGQEPWFQQHSDDLKAALDAVRARLGSLDVTCNAGTGEIWINGRRETDWASSSGVRVVAGDVEVEARALGFVTQTRTIHVAAGERATAAFQLVRSTDTGGPLASMGAAPIPLKKESVASTGGAPHHGLPVDLLKPAGIATLAGGLALIAGGSVALAVRDSNAAVYNDDGRCFYGGLTRDQRCGGYRAAASTAGDLAIVQVGVAAAALVASGIFVGLAAKTQEPVVGEAKCWVGMGISCAAPF